MWIAIFGSVLVCAVLSVIYLLSRFKKFGIVKKISKDKKGFALAISAIIVLVLSAVLTLAMGSMNSIICILHLVVIWLICDFVCFIIKKLRRRELQKYYGGAAAILLTVCYLSAGWYFAHHVVRTSYVIPSDKNIGSLRIVQFADSHVGATFDAEKFSEYIDNIQNEKPDAVLITGDFVDDDTSREDMLESCRALKNLNTAYGVYFAYGNHDKGYYEEERRGWSNEDLKAELTANGVTVLEDESVLIDDRFYIIGRQDHSETERGGSRADMNVLTKDLDKDKYMIVMDHQPHDYPAQADSGVDLVLSGHTHGGQLIPITYAGEWMGVNYRTYGHEKRDNTNFIVTSGIGDWAIQFKTGCKSEYVVIDIEGS